MNWHKGDDVIIHPSVSDEEAKKLFPNYKSHLVSRPSCNRIGVLILLPRDSLICEPRH